jgi:hypothetical protein
MAFIAPAIPYIMAATAAVTAISAVQQGRAAKAASKFNEQVNLENAALARQEALDQAVQADRDKYLRLGAIRAAQGHAGGAAGEGSVLDVLGDVAAQSELEKQDILYRGELRARSYGNTATLDRMSGSAAQSRANMAAGSELLSGASSAYSSYGKLKRA